MRSPEEYCSIKKINDEKNYINRSIAAIDKISIPGFTNPEKHCNQLFSSISKDFLFEMCTQLSVPRALEYVDSLYYDYDKEYQMCSEHIINLLYDIIVSPQKISFPDFYRVGSYNAHIYTVHDMLRDYYITNDSGDIDELAGLYEFISNRYSKTNVNHETLTSDMSVEENNLKKRHNESITTLISLIEERRYDFNV